MQWKSAIDRFCGCERTTVFAAFRAVRHASPGAGARASRLRPTFSAPELLGARSARLNAVRPDGVAFIAASHSCYRPMPPAPQAPHPRSARGAAGSPLMSGALRRVVLSPRLGLNCEPLEVRRAEMRRGAEGAMTCPEIRLGRPTNLEGP